LGDIAAPIDRGDCLITHAGAFALWSTPSGRKSSNRPKTIQGQCNLVPQERDAINPAPLRIRSDRRIAVTWVNGVNASVSGETQALRAFRVK
jgi:hypothetical protein